MQSLILLALAAVQSAPLGQEQESLRLPAPSPTLEIREPRIPIGAKHTPGDANSVYRISERGSYYLTRSVLGQSGKSAIEVGASDVTIDLMGFALIGQPGTVSGIVQDGSLSRVRVVNGSVVDFGEHGIDLTTVDDARIERVTASENGQHGILVGDYAIVSLCQARENGGRGIWVKNDSRISDCVSTQNQGNGIHAKSGGWVTRCVAYYNLQNGIEIEKGGAVLSSEARTNTLDGIRIGENAVAKDCLSISNNGNGIQTARDSRVEGCTTNRNKASGILAGGYTHILRNTCNYNGIAGSHAGIWATSGFSVVEDNSSMNNEYAGYIVEGPRSLIRRNVAGYNAVNWAVFANNIGLIIDASAGGAVLGHAGGVAPGSDDPTANYSL